MNNHPNLILAAAIVSWMIAPALGAPATGPLSRLPSNPRYFTDGSGKAIYLTGSHTWANFATDQGATDPPAPFDYNGYLEFLVAHNHNFFRAWVWDLPYSVQGHNGGPFYWSPFPWQRTGPGQATDGKLKFDLSRFNEAYFDRLRTRVIAARDRGIYVSIMLFQAYALQFNRSDTDGYPLDGRNNINQVDAGAGHAANTLEIPAVTAKQEEYVRKVIDSVNDLDNVLYEIAKRGRPVCNAVAISHDRFHPSLREDQAKAAPGRHDVSIYRGHFEELFASPADWISPDCSKGYTGGPARLPAARK